MKKLKFIYNMSLEFGNDITEHNFSLKCIPHSTYTQHIYSLDYKIEPAEKINETTDGFGNKIYIGHCRNPHDHFGFNISGIAWVDQKKAKKEPLNRIFLYESEFVRLSKKLKNFHSQIKFEENESTFKKAERIMHYVYENMEYVKGVTSINTTTDDVLDIKKGVCQDYAHLMTGLCRLEKIPARYAAGLMIGEGATHAWIEIYDNGVWRGFDPTNDNIVNDYYIKLSHGRDYRDCVIDKGTFVGNAVQTQNVYVCVKEI